MPPSPMVSSQDALMAELAGDASASITSVDPLGLDTKDPLEVVPPPAPAKPIAAKLDSLHATRVGGKGYAVTVRGDYYAPAVDFPGKKVKKPYQVTVNLPSLDAAMSVIKHKLLDAAVRRKHADFIGVRTHEIVGAVPLSAETAESNHLQFMNRERLTSYIRDHAVPLDSASYPDVVVLRSAVIDYTLNPAGFEKREAARQAERRASDELAALNPELSAVAEAA